MAWKEKHNFILKNKIDIIKKYKENIPIKKISEIYNVSKGCISNNLRLWGAIQRHGIKYLLGKIYEKQ
jgi:hypothetical protein